MQLVNLHAVAYSGPAVNRKFHRISCLSIRGAGGSAGAFPAAPARKHLPGARRKIAWIPAYRHLKVYGDLHSPNYSPSVSISIDYNVKKTANSVPLLLNPQARCSIYICPMPSRLQFSVASEADIPALNHLVNIAYRGEASKKGWTTEADLLGGIRTDIDSLRRLLEQPDSVILTCREEPKLIGCVYLHKQENKMYLGMLTVSPELQDRGIGKELLKVAEAYALTKSCFYMVMTVITLRNELIKWYQRRGYRDTGERKPFPGDPRFGIPKQPLEFLVMEKQLKPGQEV